MGDQPKLDSSSRALLESIKNRQAQGESTDLLDVLSGGYPPKVFSDKLIGLEERGLVITQQMGAVGRSNVTITDLGNEYVGLYPLSGYSDSEPEEGQSDVFPEPTI